MPGHRLGALHCPTSDFPWSRTSLPYRPAHPDQNSARSRSSQYWTLLLVTLLVLLVTMLLGFAHLPWLVTCLALPWLCCLLAFFFCPCYILFHLPTAEFESVTQTCLQLGFWVWFKFCPMICTCMRSGRQAWGREGWQANYNKWEWLWSQTPGFHIW